MNTRRDSAKCRRLTLETWRRLDEMGRPFMTCQCGRGLRPSCGNLINPAHSHTWRAHHVIPWADGGQDTAENLVPILTVCDIETTAPEDTAQIAKNQRIRDRRSGVKVPKSPMVGSRHHPSKIRRRMNGTTTKWR